MHGWDERSNLANPTTVGDEVRLRGNPEQRRRFGRLRRRLRRSRPQPHHLRQGNQPLRRNCPIPVFVLIDCRENERMEREKNKKKRG